MSSSRRGALVAAALFLSSTAFAGGLFLPVRGVRPAARGGAFVAGADDLGALWYNPAGLAALAGGKEKHAALVDVSIVGHSVSYTRVDSGGNVLPTVNDDAQFTPVPTLAVSWDLGPKAVLAAGVVAPDAARDGYPEDGPQRYSLVSTHDTLFAVVEVAIGWRPLPNLAIGAGLQDGISSFHSRVVTSACPGQTFCSPEDPEFDALSEIEWNEYFVPSGVMGAQLFAGKHLTLGAAFQLPFKASGEGTLRVRLPSSGFFDGAKITGDKADVALTLPAILRLGAEVTPSRRLHIEAGFDVEFWSEQKALNIVPKNMRIENAAGVGTYDLGPMSIPQNFKDTYAVRLGLEGEPLKKQPLVVRAGYVHETGATKDTFLSVMTPDSDKDLITFGLAYAFGHTRFDVLFAHAFLKSRNVAPGTSCVPLINPIRSGQMPTPPPPGSDCVHDGDPDHVYVGDGKYSGSWDVFGLGMNVDF